MCSRNARRHHFFFFFLFLPAKTTSRFFPAGGSFSVNTNTGAVTVLCWLVASFYSFACQTNLSGVPSQGQCWERIKTVKMATVTGSWHSLHLGMMSTFDIVWPCPKIIIPQLNSTQAEAAPGYESPAPPTFFPIYSWLSSLFLLPSPWLFIHVLSFYYLFLFSPPSIHWYFAPSSAPCYSLSPCLSAINPLCSSGLNQASSAAATILVSFIYFSFTLYPLSLLLYPSISLHVSAFSLLSTYFCLLLH